jgi:hypothetical protein
MKYLSNKKTIYFLLSWLVILGLIQLFLGGKIGFQSHQIGLIEEQILTFKKNNKQLEEKIAQNSSLQLIEKRALVQGFIKESQIEDFSFEKSFALKP